MIYLLPNTSALEVRPLYAHPDVGTILTPENSGTRILSRFGCVWAADNGCFKRGDAFDVGRYLRWLESLTRFADSCLFATAPDVVGDSRATWERSREVLPELRNMGYLAALVAQDGLESGATPWHAFDALFVGGTTAWKLSESAYKLAGEAKARGKWVHLGRVNSEQRFKQRWQRVIKASMARWRRSAQLNTRRASGNGLI